MSDRIGVMRDGKLVQVGTPHEIYTAPETKFVSEFMGDVNIMPVRLAADGQADRRPISTRRSAAPQPANGMTAGHLVIRPEFVRFLAVAGGGGQQPRRAGSTTNMRSARASSTRCASASRSSSSRSCASRPIGASSTTRC